MEFTLFCHGNTYYLNNRNHYTMFQYEANTELKDLDLTEIKNILTLRYDPRPKSECEVLHPSDFNPYKIGNVEENILQIIGNDLLNFRENLKFEKVIVPLSSGVDSNFTLVMLRKILPDVKVKSICIGFGNEDDEVVQAKENARLLDSDFEAIIKNDFLADLPRLIKIAKVPRWNLYTYYSFETGRKSSDFFFTGDGGDETFGGYTFRYSKFLSLLQNDSTWEDRVKIYLECHARDWIPAQHSLFGPRIKFSWKEIHSLLRAHFDNELHPLDQVFLADFNGKLTYEWIPLNAMYEKYLDITIKSFFLTPDFIKFATHVPWQQKYDPINRQGKLPIYSLLSKSPFCKHIKSVKKGFSANLSYVWEQNGKEITESYLNSGSEIVKDGIVSNDWIKEIGGKLAGGLLKERERYISKLFSLLALEIWYRIFISRTLGGTEKL